MSQQGSLVLGLDLGVASIGWALLDPENQRFAAAGVRVFDSGMDQRKFEKGEAGGSNNVERRQARLHRRQLRRRAARHRDLFECLQKAGLLPQEPHGGFPENRHAILTELDRQLTGTWTPRIRAEAPDVVAPEHVLPYYLRARALDHALEPHELGRALYHLGQRRGFKSNRREGRKVAPEAAAGKKAAEERSKVLADIAALEKNIPGSGARTLGEYLSRQEPAQPQSIRRRWTSRRMFEQEFEVIWSAQAAYHPVRLTAALKQCIHHLLFDQRPIADGKPGKCELEEGCVRGDMFTLAAQRFRLLQKVNDLAMVNGNEDKTKLTDEQRRLLADRLEAQGDLTFGQIRTMLGLPKKIRFNLEAGGDKKRPLPGNRTAKVMRRAFGDRWLSLPEPEQKHIVRVWAKTDDSEELARIALAQWKLDPALARELAEAEPEDGYAALSSRALSKLLPGMEAGKPFKEVETKVYGNRFSGRPGKDFLPPVEDVLPRIPNPAVMRALTELRKVVNAIVRKYGKPAKVRVELARDLKRNAKDRARLLEGANKNRRLRASAAKRILQENGNPKPSRDDENRVLLMEELPECAYCGKAISFSDLFNGQVEVDHILPLGRFPDNSFSNKTLACSACNKLKAGRTPGEAFGTDSETWDGITRRIACIKSWDKQQRFRLRSAEEIAEFSARHLSDTRYISKLAARYLEELYGGRDVALPDEDARRAVYASSGMVTATLRRAWGLESILREAAFSANGQNRGKPRSDHRHHAVDAITIALTSQTTIQQLSAAVVSGDQGRERVSSRTLAAPWPNLVASVRPLIEGLTVSHRPSHTLSGALHDETNYSQPKSYGGKEVSHVRKPVHLLTTKQIASDHVIVDGAARAAVRARLAELGGDPKKLENSPAVLRTHSGKAVPIRKVRIRVAGATQRIGQGQRERYVALSGNHHIALFAGPDRKGRPAWHGIVVSRLDAMERKRKRQEIIQRGLPEHADYEFLFSLMGGDIVEMKHPERDSRELFVVRTISEASSGAIEVAFARQTDARLKAEMLSEGSWIRIRRVDELQQLGCQKVVVDLLGNVHPAHD